MVSGRTCGAVSTRLALGVTTVALVALASAGTAVVVRTGASSVNLGSLPAQVALPAVVGGSAAIIVALPPGWSRPDIRNTSSTSTPIVPDVVARPQIAPLL